MHMANINRPHNLRTRARQAGLLSMLAAVIAGVLTGCGEPVRPGVGDHWHVAYGFYVCDEYVGNLRGNLEEVDENGKPVSKNFGIVGVHSHDDGLIHFHPFSGLAAGPKANLGLFLSMYEIGMDDSQLDLPEYLGGTIYEYVTACDTPEGQVDGELRVQYWPDATNPEQYEVFTENLTDIPLTQDGAAVAVMFVPAGVVAPLPPSVGAPITDIPGGGALGGTTTTAPTTPSTTAPTTPSTTQP